MQPVPYRETLGGLLSQAPVRRWPHVVMSGLRRAAAGGRPRGSGDEAVFCL